MRKPQLVALLSVLAMIVAVGVIYWTQFRDESPEVTRLAEGLGMAVAEESARLAGGSGKVVLILPKRGTFVDPLVEIQRAAFEKALAGHAGVSLLATESIETERPGTMGAGGLDPAEFQAILTRAAGAKVVVSLAGLPEFPADAPLTAAGRKIVVVGSGTPQLKALLAAEVVQVAIMPRVKPAAPTEQPKTAREWFRHRYEIITPANVGSLP